MDHVSPYPLYFIRFHYVNNNYHLQITLNKNDIHYQLGAIYSITDL